MTSTKANPGKSVTLEQVLRRGDVWRGQSQRFVPHAALDTGYQELNKRLLNKGWPLASLLEIGQPCALSNTGLAAQAEWLLFAPAIRQIKEGYTVLLNPPALPFAPGLIQAGIDLDRLLIVEAEKKTDFLASFTELARAEICTTLMAWQPKQNLNYTELRKCQLACADGKGLYLLFRPLSAQQQSSPAALRLRANLSADFLEIHIFKQKGSLHQVEKSPTQLPLPHSWLPTTPHAHLYRTTHEAEITSDKKIIDLKRNLL